MKYKSVQYSLDKTLPNGWTCELSNEIYTDLKGRNYEEKEIPPNIHIDCSPDADEFFYESLKAEIKSKKDKAIESALSLFINS